MPLDLGTSTKLRARGLTVPAFPPDSTMPYSAKRGPRIAGNYELKLSANRIYRTGLVSKTSGNSRNLASFCFLF